MCFPFASQLLEFDGFVSTLATPGHGSVTVSVVMGLVCHRILRPRLRYATVKVTLTGPSDSSGSAATIASVKEKRSVSHLNQNKRN